MGADSAAGGGAFKAPGGALNVGGGVAQPDVQQVVACEPDGVVHRMLLVQLAVRVQSARLDAAEAEADACRVGGELQTEIC